MHLSILLAAVTFMSAAESINTPELYEAFVKEFSSDAGVTVEVHGADHTNGLYVISFRPQSFFDYIIISVQADYTAPEYLTVKQRLSELRRHDFIRIKGIANPLVSSAQNHILLRELEVVNVFTPPMTEIPGYVHGTKLLKDIGDNTELIVKVHASLVDGTVFVVEYGDANIPVVVQDASLTKDLYRGDKVKIQFSVQPFPTSPVHLLLKDLTVIDRVVEQHGQPQKRCGELVMFPQSPQVKFNVFAIKSDMGDGLFRTYTIINFQDIDLFLAMRDKAQAVWDANAATAVAGRNYYVNPNVEVCAEGLGNMIVPTQANPQVVVDDIDKLTFSVK